MARSRDMRLFSPEHLAAIAATAVGAVLIVAVMRRLAGGVAIDPRLPGIVRNTPVVGGAAAVGGAGAVGGTAVVGGAGAAGRTGAAGGTGAVVIARGLALVILAGFVVEQVTYVARGLWTASVNLPLQLSDAATLVTIAALWRPRPGLMTELVWFWAFSATLQAVLTPDLDETFPDVLYFTFFATHSGVILGACLLVPGLRLAPRPRAALRVLGLTACFAVLAAAGCLATGGNYMFLRAKPGTGSLLDALGPWPWYILGAAVLGLVMLLVLEAIARPLTRGGRPAAS
jgi:hypothetical integral membrane protein (TIGR02206 family)